MFGVHAVDVRRVLFRAVLLVVLSGSSIGQNLGEDANDDGEIMFGLMRANTLFLEAHGRAETNIIARSKPIAPGYLDMELGPEMERYEVDAKGRIIEGTQTRRESRWQDFSHARTGPMFLHWSNAPRTAANGSYLHHNDQTLDSGFLWRTNENSRILYRRGTKQEYAYHLNRAVLLDASGQGEGSNYVSRYLHKKDSYGSGRVRWVVNTPSVND